MVNLSLTLVNHLWWWWLFKRLNCFIKLFQLFIDALHYNTSNRVWILIRDPDPKLQPTLEGVLYASHT